MKEEAIVLSRGFYWIEEDIHRWMSDSSEIIIVDNKKYDFIILKINSYAEEPKECRVLVKEVDKEYDEKKRFFIKGEANIKIPLKNLESIKIEGEYFIPDNDDRKLSFLFEGVVFEKDGNYTDLNIKQIKTGYEFGYKKMYGLEFVDEKTRDKIYEKSRLIPDNFDWQEYAFKEGNKRIKSESEAIEHLLVGRRITPFGEKPSKTLLVSTLFFVPDEKSESFLEKSIVEMHEQLSDQLNLVFVIRNNSINEGSKKINEIILKLKNKMNIIYSEGENLGYGKGHNTNFKKYPCDYFLILNDDLDFLNFEWIKESIILFEDNEKLAFIGSDDSPRYINKYGFGKTNRDKFSQDYVEGSILITKSSVFSELGGFDENIEYFYFEDVDLSFRAKQKGYEVDYINIPHEHYRSNSAKKLNQETLSAINELNRAKFLSKWSLYLSNTKNLRNKNLIILDSDGFGDLTDFFYPTLELVNRNKDKNLSVYISNKKMNFLYESLDIEIQNCKYDLSIKDYDQIYTTKGINFSVPFHTLDLVASNFGIEEFSCEEKIVKKFVSELELSQETKILLKKDLSEYYVMHLDSQRKGFEARQPDLKTFIASIELISQKDVILIGDYSLEKDKEYESYIKQNKKVIDLRKVVTVKDMAILISNSQMFFGIDSGPSHLAQLFNVPSFILYGPIHPLTKIYRYENSGTFYKNDKTCGQYHRCTEPAYYYDIERDFKCVNIKDKDLADSLSKYINNNFKFDWTPYFDSLRFRQREWCMLQIHNPFFQNRLIKYAGQPTKQYIDEMIRRP